MIELWTDGATSGNGKENAVGGWAYVIVKDGQILTRGHGGELNTTNNRCEYLAMINGLRAIEDLELENETIIGYSDSALLINTLTQWIHGWKNAGWVKKSAGEIKNLDLVKILYPYTLKTNINFVKTKGHSGIFYNEMCDTMAVAARKALEAGC